MTSHDNRTDVPLDAALEVLARPEPPAGHVDRVLSRTTGDPEAGVGVGLVRRMARRPSLRAALPVAATLLVALVLAWQAARAPVAWPDVVEMDGAGRMDDEIVKPVLPPEAYWAMDAFEEWRSLGRDAGGRVQASGHQEPVGTRRSQAADDELAWAPVPSGLPDIELTSIVPAPLTTVPLDEPAPITLAPIALDPIELAPLDEEEKP